MDPKIAILFVLTGSVIGLSRLSDGNLETLRDQIGEICWRGLLRRAWRKK